MAKAKRKFMTKVTTTAKAKSRGKAVAKTKTSKPNPTYKMLARVPKLVWIAAFLCVVIGYGFAVYKSSKSQLRGVQTHVEEAFKPLVADWSTIYAGLLSLFTFLLFITAWYSCES